MQLVANDVFRSVLIYTDDDFDVSNIWRYRLVAFKSTFVLMDHGHSPSTVKNFDVEVVCTYSAQAKIDFDFGLLE